MRRNWFLTQNNMIHDLNRFIAFGIHEYLMEVFATTLEYENIRIGKFERLDEAKEYLKKIYEQLWDENE